MTLKTIGNPKACFKTNLRYGWRAISEERIADNVLESSGDIYRYEKTYLQRCILRLVKNIKCPFDILMLCCVVLC